MESFIATVEDDNLRWLPSHPDDDRGIDPTSSSAKVRSRRSCELLTLLNRAWTMVGPAEECREIVRGKDVFEMRQTLLPRPFLIFISSFEICIPRLGRLSDRRKTLRARTSLVAELFYKGS